MRVIAIGASAGGVEALSQVASALPSAFPAAVLVVLHVGSYPSILPRLLANCGPLPARHAVDGQLIVPGEICIAPPDRHLLVEDGHLWLTRGPREHHARPAIDPLFRSVALAFQSEAIGVVLTGRLDDGTAGLQAIKSVGGIAIVQDPAEASEPSMPSSALRYAEPDHCVALSALAPLLASLCRSDVAATESGSELAAHELAISLFQGDPMEHLQAIGAPSPFVCPDCKGGLWQLASTQPKRFRCHTGHAYTLRTLQHAQSDATDEAVWSAVRALQEEALLLRELLAQESEGGMGQGMDGISAQMRQLERRSAELREFAEHQKLPQEPFRT